jgi:hypothetical protein
VEGGHRESVERGWMLLCGAAEPPDEALERQALEVEQRVDEERDRRGAAILGVVVKVDEASERLAKIVLIRAENHVEHDPARLARSACPWAETKVLYDLYGVALVDLQRRVREVLSVRHGVP